MVQVLYLLEVCILVHYYGPPSTETPTTETTIVRCHKNNWIYLTSTYYWWLLRPTITIRFHSKFQIIAQLFDSIRNEKNTIRTTLKCTNIQRRMHLWKQCTDYTNNMKNMHNNCILQVDKWHQLTEGWTRRIRDMRFDDGVAAADVTALPCRSDRRFCAIAAFCCFRSSSSRLASSLAAKLTGVGTDGVAASCCGLSDAFSWAAAAAFCFSILSPCQHVTPGKARHQK